MAGGRSRRRHDREVKATNRMRFVRECWSVYQPGITDHSDPTWFVPGRFAKIHPARVCSCEMCSGDRSQRKRDRAAAKRRLQRDPEHA